MVRFLHGAVDGMATSLTVAFNFTIIPCRSEVLRDCGNVSLSSSLVGSRRLFRHRHVQNWQRQEGKKGPSVCRALFGWNKAPDDENDEGDDSTDDDSSSDANNDDSSNDTNNVTPFFPRYCSYCIVLCLMSAGHIFVLLLTWRMTMLTILNVTLLR